MESIALPSRIQSPRLELRKHEVELAGTMFSHVDRDRERLGRFLPFPQYTTCVDDQTRYILQKREEWAARTCFDFGMFEIETDTYLGNVGVHHIEWEQAACQFGYWILGEFEGRGFVSESCRALESCLFKNGFHRIEIRCNPANERSANIPKSLHYRLDGLLRENVLEHGKFCDTAVFSKLSTDVA